MMRTRAGMCIFFCEMHPGSVMRINLKMRLACKPGFAEQMQNLKDSAHLEPGFRLKCVCIRRLECQAEGQADTYS